MRQIIQVQVGRCGNSIGAQFWETISEEHNIDAMGRHAKDPSRHENLSVFYNEDSSGAYSARAVLTDLESGAVESVLAGKYSRLFKHENAICGQSSASNNFGKGYYSEGSQYIEYAADAIRREAEACESIEAFQVVHSVGGGTGSGFGSLIMNKIHDEYADKIVEAFTVLPSSKVSDTVVEPYNAVLAFPALINYATLCITLDNEALYDISSNKSKSTTYRNMNSLVASAMSGLTCGTRFSGQLTASLRKIAVNMIPSPKQHFFITGCPPFMVDQQKQQINKNRSGVLEISSRIFVGNYYFCKAEIGAGRHICASCIFRGQISSYEVEKRMFKIQDISTSYFVQWIPNNIQSTICQVPHKGFKTSSTYLVNSTAINFVFNRLLDRFRYMFRRKAFLHWYTQEGVEEIQFTEAENGMNELIDSYASNQVQVEQAVQQQQQY